MDGQLVSQMKLDFKSKPRKIGEVCVDYRLERELYFQSIGKGNDEYIERLKELL